MLTADFQFLSYVTIKRQRPDWREKLAALRQRFILTREEQKVIVFVFAVFVLGVGAKYYREAHPQPSQPFDTKHQRRTDQLSESSSPQKAEKKPQKKKLSASPPQSDG